MQNSEHPFLSVVMPVFNGSQTLERTLNSLLGQQNGIELIAVVQASADGSREIIEAYSDRIRTHVIDAANSKSWMQTSNIGLAAAQSRLCSFLHQDDIWRGGRLQALRQLVKRHPQACLWLHDADFIDNEDHVVGRFGPPFGTTERIIPVGQLLATILTQNTVAIPAATFDRDLAREVGGLDETLWYTADWDLWLKLARRGEVAWLPRRLAGFRLHANSLTMKGSRDTGDFRQQMEAVVDRHSGALSGRDVTRVRKMAEASIDINVCLAAAFHRQYGDCATALAKILSLGPLSMSQFVRYSQITQRVLSRLRTRWPPKGDYLA